MKQHAPAAAGTASRSARCSRSTCRRAGSSSRSRAAAASTPCTWRPRCRRCAGSRATSRRDALASIEAWRLEAGLPNLLPPVALDVTAPAWPVDRRGRDRLHQHGPHRAVGGRARACSPAPARTLPLDGVLYLYGPYPASAARPRRRTRSSIAGCARATRAGACATWASWRRPRGARGLELAATVPMPANNHSLVLRRRAAGRDAIRESREHERA